MFFVIDSDGDLLLHESVNEIEEYYEYPEVKEELLRCCDSSGVVYDFKSIDREIYLEQSNHKDIELPNSYIIEYAKSKNILESEAVDIIETKTGYENILLEIDQLSYSREVNIFKAFVNKISSLFK